MIKKLVASNVTILLTTQYLEEADQLADRIAVLNDGKIIAEGTADELKQKVGKARLELVIKGDVAQAAAAIDGDAVQTDPAERTVSVAIDEGVTEIKRVLDQLEKAGVAVESLSLHKPTLDDVFMQLTGHKAEETKETAEAK